MTTASESEILTRVGAGTPMGELMRQYWLPVAKSSELVADGEPVRLLILGEKLIAFRDSLGRVGVMDHRCPHRCASLFFGRNEEGGIRCVYHGWKFDVDGNCLDMANVPPHQDFKHKVRAKTYKAAERNGLVWAYMGPRQIAPPLPALEATLVPEAEVDIDFIQRECNWLQGMEGDIDTSHLSFLHLGGIGASADNVEDTPGGIIDRNVLANRHPEFVIEDMPFGTTYGAYRPADAGGTYWRFAHFFYPFWTMAPINAFENNVLARAWVPMDDTRTMSVRIAHKNMRFGRPDPKTAPVGTVARAVYVPNSTEWSGRWRLRQNRSNDYEIDRQIQRTASYTGIDGIQLQDQAVTESMGAIVDHAMEHPAPSDAMILRTRRHLLTAARNVIEGKIPPGVDEPDIYAPQRAGHFVADGNLGWREAYADRIARDVTRPRGEP